MNKRLILVLPDRGIYLGHAGDQYFWSKDTLGDLPRFAIAFRSRQEVQGFLFKEFGIELPLSAVPAIPVECERDQHASLYECHKVGLTLWNFLAENELPC